MSIFCRGSITPSTPFPPISILQKQLKTYLLFQKSLNNGCNNLNFHFYTFDMICKSFSYLTTLNRHGSVNPSTLTFDGINLTKTMTNLIVASKINQK